MPPSFLAEAVPPTPLSHAILLALVDEDRHGYGIIKEIVRQTEGVLNPGTGTLYAALHRMMEEGLLAASPTQPAPGDDPRRKYYRLTERGRSVARAETLRLARLVVVAREKKLVSELGTAGSAGPP
jgi:DNA-binding PadR family transcriptional regulator